MIVEQHTHMVANIAKKGQDIADELTGNNADLWHHATGIATEAGELLSAVKKVVIYGQDPNVTNIIEELGDIEFYMEGIRQNLDITRFETLQANIDKLAKRYPNYDYTDNRAKARADKVGED